jgi:hypothetical protein
MIRIVLSMLLAGFFATAVVAETPEKQAFLSFLAG